MDNNLESQNLNNLTEVDSGNGYHGKTLLVINTGPLEKKFIFQKLKKMDLKIVVLNGEKNWAEPYVDHWIIADTFNHADSIKKLNLFLKNNAEIKIDGVVTFWEDDVLLTSKIVDKLDLIGVPFNISAQVRNKYLFREFCGKNGITTPHYKIIKNKDDLEYVKNSFNFPLVVKPVFGSRGAFVLKVDEANGLEEAFNYIQKIISSDVETALADGMDIFVEEYISGNEVDIDILLQNGKIKFYAVSDNFNKDKGEFFIDSGQATPSTLPEVNQKELIEMAEETLEKLGIQNGCIHFEAKSTKNGPVPLEVNLRLGGDYVYSYIKDAWGVDLIEGAVKIAFGSFLKNMKNLMPRKYVVGWDLYPDNSGLVVELSVSDELKRKKYLEDIDLYREVGDAILLPPEGYESLGWLTVSGANYLDAQDNLKEALSYISYSVVKFTNSSSIGKTTRKDRYSSAVLNKNLLIQAAKVESIKKRITKENQRNLHIGIACNVNDSQNPIEADLTSIGNIIQKTLQGLGYKVTFFDFNNIGEAFNQLKNSDVDVVFNVCERINNSSLLEPHAASILDVLQIPYTGSNPTTLALCIDKIRVKKLLSYHNIPTPEWDYVYTMDDDIREDLQYPLIVKPANSDNSIGITNDSVVTNKEELNRELKKVIEGLKSPALIEEYIEGDEYDVNVIGNDAKDLRVLPLSRSIFKEMPEGYWHIYPFDAKWGINDAVYDKIIIQTPPRNVSKKLESLLSEIALDTYNILDCHDYGRIEIRVDKDDNPYVLELNPNPSINEGDSTPGVAELIGMNYGDFLEEVIRMAIKRYKNNPPYNHLQTNWI